MNKIIILSLLIFILAGMLAPVYAASQVQDYICELGIKYYEQGEYDQALEEFNKALMIDPGYKPALKYIEMIKQASAKTGSREVVPEVNLIQQEMIYEKQAALPESSFPATAAPELVEPAREIPAAKAPLFAPANVKQAYTPKEIALDDSFKMIMQPIEIEQDKQVILYGKNIQRFLVTQPDILTVEQINADELLITGQKIGYTYVYVWDDFGRWTTEFLGVFPVSQGPTLEEEMRQEDERIGTFKFRYGVDWDSFEQGRRLNSLKRQMYSWEHNLALTGSTPYGNLDSNLIVRSLSQTTDLTYYTLGLTNGSLGNFKDFSLRGFDFYPNFTNLVFPGGAVLRGVMMNSPAFNHKIDYTVFWGREGGGRYGNLSPGLNAVKESFINGEKVDVLLPKNSKIGFTVLHGSGGDRPLNVNRDMYDINAEWHLAGLNMQYDLGYDSSTFAHLFSGDYIIPNLRFNYELRDIEKNFLPITGGDWRRGELGGLFNLDFIPKENWDINNRLDVFQQRLYPSLENDNRWNEDYDMDVRYAPDPSLAYRLNYSLDNELGILSARHYQSSGIGLSKSFSLIRTVNTSFDYSYAQSTNPGNLPSDYTNSKASVGLRINLIGDLYYFFNNEWNWLHETFTGNSSMPMATEMGIDFTSEIFRTPFYETLRFLYRNEKDTASPLSFLSGEDYIEGYSEISYRPTPDTEAYCSGRVRNVWAGKNQNVTKRIEAEFNAGMRLLWDTGLRWESEGNIEGCVFKDLNSDGLRENDEAPLEGVKVWLGKNKFQVTDLFGYYEFKGVRSAKAHVTLDASTLPPGFVLTVPISQEVAIKQGQTATIDFGVIAPSEISGFIFEDTNADGIFDGGDVGVKGAVVTLEDNRKSITDSSGKYSFVNIPTGVHTISLDLNSIPLYYLPQVPITKEVTIYEGVPYVYNIPVKKAKE